VHQLPLGYTDNFISFIRSNSISLDLNKYSEKKWSDFHGHKGNINRRQALDSAQEYKLKINENSVWGGNKNDLTRPYVESLVLGNISLVPPGFRSTESFRVYESLYLGNAVVHMPFSLNSITFNSEEYIFKRSLTWESIMNFWENLSTQELKSLVLFQQFQYEKKIVELNSLILKHLI
jgi:hypothetical protein